MSVNLKTQLLEILQISVAILFASIGLKAFLLPNGLLSSMTNVLVLSKWL